MNDDIARWQDDAQRAFDWLSKMYEQAQVVWEDAWGMLEDERWEVQCGTGFGGISMSMSKLSEWPFAYFKAMGATPPASGEAEPMKGLFFGFVFYDTKRRGPSCVAGVATWLDPNANCDHWTLCAAVNGDVPASLEKMFDHEVGPINIARINDKGKRIRKGMGDVRWFELPLGTVNSADRLREVVSAAMALYHGDDAPARSLVGQP